MAGKLEAINDNYAGTSSRYPVQRRILHPDRSIMHATLKKFSLSRQVVYRTASQPAGNFAAGVVEKSREKLSRDGGESGALKLPRRIDTTRITVALHERSLKSSGEIYYSLEFQLASFFQSPSEAPT